MAQNAEPGTQPAPHEEELRLRIAWRLLPFLCLLYFVAYLDRANVAFANTAIRSDLGFSQAAFGFGSGVFFIGYFILEIPGALIVQRWGARRWISRILITWGIVTTLLGFVHTANQFYVGRFMLGAAEAGFFPGILVYLSQWFRERERARAISVFVVTSPLAIALGAPLSALILTMHVGRLASWRWLFILEGAPAIVLGCVTLFYLTDFPVQAHWLTEPERLRRTEQLKAERANRQAVAPEHWWRALVLPQVVLLTAANFLACTGGYGFIVWLPSHLDHFGRGAGILGLAGVLRSILPFCGAAAGAILVGRLSDKSRNPRYFACASFVAAGIFLFLGSRQHSSAALPLFWLTLAGAAIYGWIAPFWVLPTLILSDDSAAAAIGLINSVGNLGGFVGSFLVGYLLFRHWSYSRAMDILCVGYMAAAVLTWLGGRRAHDFPHPIASRSWIASVRQRMTARRRKSEHVRPGDVAAAAGGGIGCGPGPDPECFDRA